MLTLKQVRQLTQGDRVIAWSDVGAPRVVTVTGDVWRRGEDEHGMLTLYVMTDAGSFAADFVFAVDQGRDVIERARERNEREAAAIQKCEREIAAVLKEQKRVRAAERRAAKQRRASCGKCGAAGTRGLICLECGAPNIGEPMGAQAQ